MDFDALEAGPELNRAVAERVMEWSPADCPSDMVFRDPGHRGVFRWWRINPNSLDHDLWSPSTDIAAAWEVVEHLRTLGMCGGVQVEEGPTKEPAPDGPTAYCASFFGTHKSDAAGYLSHETNREAYAASAPLAICRAALAAVTSRTDPTR